MNAADGFKKIVTQNLATLSVREAVTLHGDAWRFYVGKEHARCSDLVTFDGLESVSMSLMEKGISPRVRARDL